MSDYASKLQPIEDKGKCGDPEFEEQESAVNDKVRKLVSLIKKSKYCIIHTGAGISTAAGIPDFRGPNGVWTLELKGLKRIENAVSFSNASPTFTHLAIVALCKAGYVKHVVSQNVDGLHIRSGLDRSQLSEVHGTAFAEYCDNCEKEFRRSDEVDTIGLAYTGNHCQVCDEPLRDMLCDWDSELPPHEVDRAIEEHKRSDLVICIGSSLRIRPAGNWPLKTKRKNGKPNEGKIVIVNLQKTHLDKQATVRIFAKSDMVMQQLCNGLKIKP